MACPLTKRVASTDERDRLGVVHAHPAEHFADLRGAGRGIGDTHRTSRVDWSLNNAINRGRGRSARCPGVGERPARVVSGVVLSCWHSHPYHSHALKSEQAQQPFPNGSTAIRASLAVEWGSRHCCGTRHLRKSRKLARALHRKMNEGLDRNKCQNFFEGWKLRTLRQAVRKLVRRAHSARAMSQPVQPPFQARAHRRWVPPCWHRGGPRKCHSRGMGQSPPARDKFT